ncbi:MAG: hypothetical protein P8144_11165 [Gammaproteobacteria bacterium]
MQPYQNFWRARDLRLQQRLLKKVNTKTSYALLGFAALAGVFATIYALYLPFRVAHDLLSNLPLVSYETGTFYCLLMLSVTLLFILAVCYELKKFPALTKRVGQIVGGSFLFALFYANVMPPLLYVFAEQQGYQRCLAESDDYSFRSVKARWVKDLQECESAAEDLSEFKD